jgi:hypothetical protein
MIFFSQLPGRCIGTGLKDVVEKYAIEKMNANSVELGLEAVPSRINKNKTIKGKTIQI